MPARPPYPARHPSLDAWRGVASLSVLLWHAYHERGLERSGLWLGVQLFFVISGYCIASACSNALQRGMAPRTFLARRVRRIGPPYLASLFVFVVLRVLRLSEHAGWAAALDAIHYSPFQWLQNLTLTQWASLAALCQAGRCAPAPWKNPATLVGVHWSLNYEEQFYLLAGGFLVLALRTRRSGLAPWALTAAVAAFELGHPGLITGLFFDYWLQFAVGVAVFYRLCQVHTRATARLWDAGFVVATAAVATTAFRRGELPPHSLPVQLFGPLAVCLAFGLLLLTLRPLDDRLARAFPARVLGKVGTFSYSLYLVHQTLLEDAGPLRDALRLRLGWAPADALVLTGVLGAAWLFHLSFERPYLNRSPAVPSAPAAPSRALP